MNSDFRIAASQGQKEMGGLAGWVWGLGGEGRLWGFCLVGFGEFLVVWGRGV